MVAAPGSRPSAVSSNLRMWLPLVGLGLGILLGLLLNVSVTPDLARYTAVAILAGLDSILGAVRAELDGQYDNQYDNIDCDDDDAHEYIIRTTMSLMPARSLTVAFQHTMAVM